MIPIGALAKGMHVLTPGGHLARVDGLVIDSRRPDCQWANVTYYKPCDPSAPVATFSVKSLSGYKGPPVVFPEELGDLHARYGQSANGKAA